MLALVPPESFQLPTSPLAPGSRLALGKPWCPLTGLNENLVPEEAEWLDVAHGYGEPVEG